MLPAKFHVKIIIGISIALLIDSAAFGFAAIYTFYFGPSLYIFYGFEALLLILSLIRSIGRFFVNVIDASRVLEWDEKSLVLLHLDLVVGMLHI